MDATGRPGQRQTDGASDPAYMEGPGPGEPPPRPALHLQPQFHARRFHDDAFVGALPVSRMTECAKRAGHDPEAWLADVIERLPAMSNQDDLSVLLPSNWQPAAAAGGPVRETCAV